MGDLASVHIQVVVVKLLLLMKNSFYTPETSLLIVYAYHAGIV